MKEPPDKIYIIYDKQNEEWVALESLQYSEFLGPCKIGEYKLVNTFKINKLSLTQPFGVNPRKPKSTF